MSIETWLSEYPGEWYPAKYLGLGKFANVSNLDVLWNDDYTYFYLLEA